MRKDLILASVVAIAAALVSFATGRADSVGVEPSHDTSKRVVRSAAHFLPERHYTLDALSKAADVVVSGEGWSTSNRPSRSTLLQQGLRQARQVSRATS